MPGRSVKSGNRPEFSRNHRGGGIGRRSGWCGRELARPSHLLIDRAAGVRRLQFEVEGLEKLIRSIVPDGNLQTEEPAMRQALEVDSISV